MKLVISAEPLVVSLITALVVTFLLSSKVSTTTSVVHLALNHGEQLLVSTWTVDVNSLDLDDLHQQIFEFRDIHLLEVGLMWEEHLPLWLHRLLIVLVVVLVLASLVVLLALVLILAFLLILLATGSLVTR